VAYESDESGGYESYVAPCPGPGGKRQISQGDGEYPRWWADGKEVFFEAPNGKLMATEVSIKGTTIEVGTFAPLASRLISIYPTYTTSPPTASAFWSLRSETRRHETPARISTSSMKPITAISIGDCGRPTAEEAA
jgi:hypothetical protein